MKALLQGGVNNMVDNKVKEIRVARGLTQVELSRLAHVAASNLNAIERGRLLPWPKMKKRLAKALKCEESDIFPSEAEGGGDGN